MNLPNLNAVVSQRIDVTPGLMVLRVVPDGWALPSFVPGQFAVLALPAAARPVADCDPQPPPKDPTKLIKRAYSIASTSVAAEYLEFYISLLRSGTLTPRLFALKKGDRLWLSPKASGVFTLDSVPEDKHVIMIATGTGLAPYMSVLRSQLPCGGPRRFAVVHGARHSWDLGYRSELTVLQRLCPNYSYVPIISRPEEEPVEWPGLAGYVQDVWIGRVLGRLCECELSPENTHIFLCGNPGMIEEMLEILEEEGFKEHRPKSPGQVHAEKYWQ